MNPRTQKPSVVAHLYNPSIQEVETDQKFRIILSYIASQSRIYSKTKNKQTENNLRSWARVVFYKLELHLKRSNGKDIGMTNYMYTQSSLLKTTVRNPAW